MLTSRKHLPFGYKLMMSYVLLVILPVSLVGVISYTSAIASIQEQTSSMMKGTLQQMKENIGYQTKTMSRVLDQFYLDASFQQRLHLTDSYSIYQTMAEMISPKLQNMTNLVPYKTLIRLYLMNESYPEVYGDQSPAMDPLSRAYHFEIFHFQRISGEAWWQRLFEDSPQVFDGLERWVQVEEDGEYGNISSIRRLYNHQTMESIGAIRVTAKIEDVLGSVNYQRIGANTSVVVLNNDHRVLYASSGTASFPLGSPVDEAWYDNHLIMEEPIEGLDWHIIAFVPYSDLEQGANRVRTITIIICIIAIMVVIGVSYSISRFFSKRINKLIHSMEAFRQGQLDKRIVYHGNDEFAQIADAFNWMAVETKELIQEVYLANLEKKEAELESLQAQINPHFLYNTLNSIRTLGKFRDFDKQDQIIKELATFYRITLNNGKNIIPVTAELQHAQAYVTIQKMKHGSRMMVDYDIHADIYGFETIKLILQPFLENILEHALYVDPIHIRLQAYKDEGRLVFKIIDNGVGMSKDIQKRILDQSEVGLGYGIRNVHERIRLQYGLAYGVAIYSRVGMGTAIVITIPARKKDDSGLRD
ncbi:sensor histidine kinase [Xylanibacillus composti]|uniref:histidine kinase n=1 Tax=Xylanibacillus composti TaxID=1572762 RepID=A0A8J4H174_9BACL|nr:sensor histidine kinase [Xylanibacillus composti]MDT9725745.1 sensor histidine kinase [Xylanibacillus composti]GIQ67541.1 hypothetical protein XYCOK13_03650 [Xylanibacillus composti]